MKAQAVNSAFAAIYWLKFLFHKVIEQSIIEQCNARKVVDHTSDHTYCNSDAAYGTLTIKIQTIQH